MKNKVKKIPKYSTGNPGVTAEYLKKVGGGAPTIDTGSSTTEVTNSSGTTGSGGGIGWGAIGAAATKVGKGIMHSFGVEDNSQLGTTLNNSMEWAELGGSIVPGWGHLIGGVAGATFGAFQKGGVDPNTGEIKYGGIFGRSKESLLAEQSTIKNNIRATQMTEQKKAEYAMNPNNPNGGKIMAAEGGIMRKPVDALVSKGELIYNPVTKKLSQVPGSKGKPNKADDVYAKLYEGDVVISNSPTMLMANGRTPAQNLMGMVDKYATGGTVKAREAIIKKVVNWQEANKTKPQEYAKFDGGGIAGINKYRYNKNMSDFAYWDKDKNEYKKEYLDWVNNLTEQDVRDIEAGKYGDMTEYFSKNKGKKLDVATAQKLMTDKKYGNWHKIGEAIVDSKLYPKHLSTIKPSTVFPGTTEINGLNIQKLKTLPNPSLADGFASARRSVAKQNRLNWLNDISDLLPIVGGLFDKYDWHTEQPQISGVKYVPVNADPTPLLRAADESHSIGNYNLANRGVSTGAYMAHNAQLVADRAKQYADAYKWQQETNNKLIAQNAGIHNDWTKRYDAAKYQAIADTIANEGAAQQMRDQSRKDRLEFYYGKRNDDMLASMMKPMFEQGTPDEAYKQIYKRRIV